MPIMYRGLLSTTLQLIRLTNSEPVRYKLNDVRVRYNEMQIFISPFIVPQFSLASKRIQNKVFKLLSKGKSLRILFPPFIFAHSVALQCDHNWQYLNRTPKRTHLRRILSAYTTEDYTTCTKFNFTFPSLLCTRSLFTKCLPKFYNYELLLLHA